MRSHDIKRQTSVNAERQMLMSLRNVVEYNTIKIVNTPVCTFYEDEYSESPKLFNISITNAQLLRESLID